MHAAWDSGRPRLCVHARCDTTSMRCQRGCVAVALLCVILLPCASVACFVLSRTVLCSVVFVTGPAATLWSSNSSAPFAAVRHFLEEDDGRSDGRSDAAVVLHALCLNQLQSTQHSISALLCLAAGHTSSVSQALSLRTFAIQLVAVVALALIASTYAAALLPCPLMPL